MSDRVKTGLLIVLVWSATLGVALAINATIDAHMQAHCSLLMTYAKTNSDTLVVFAGNERCLHLAIR